VEVVETVDITKKIVGVGVGVLAAGVAGFKLIESSGDETSSEPEPLVIKQNFLEAKPYWDQSDVPVNVFKNKAPFTGKVVSTKRIVGPQATDETMHIVIDHNGSHDVR
jgi:ferredoxin--NADP+ reductase